VGVSHNRARIVACAEALLDQFVETELLWPGHFSGAIQWRAHGNPPGRFGDIVSRHGLAEHRCQSTVVPSVMLLTNSKNCVAHERSDTGDYSGGISSQTRCVEREFAR
jgi:hypothetical protein